MKRVLAQLKGDEMLNWIITFFLLAVIAAVLGFGGLAGVFAGVAKFLAIIFVVLFIGSIAYNISNNRHPPSSL
jgi:uncharacterized membrane protein YtjA (UPF0391 family)